MGRCGRPDGSSGHFPRSITIPNTKCARFGATLKQREPPWLANRLPHLGPEHTYRPAESNRRVEPFMETKDIELVHNEAAQRFEAHIGGQTAFLTYRRFPDRFVLVHTEVPPALEDQGIAGKLVAAALDFARAAHLRVIPLCPYVSDFISKHPEYLDLVSEKDRAQILEHAEKAATQRADALRLMAFYEIARRANLTNHPELVKLPAFQKARELHEARTKYLWEGFPSQEAINDYFKFHLEGALARQGKSWKDDWEEFAPESLKTFPLPPGALT